MAADFGTSREALNRLRADVRTFGLAVLSEEAREWGKMGAPYIPNLKAVQTAIALAFEAGVTFGRRQGPSKPIPKPDQKHMDVDGHPLKVGSFVEVVRETCGQPSLVPFLGQPGLVVMLCPFGRTSLVRFNTTWGTPEIMLQDSWVRVL